MEKRRAGICAKIVVCGSHYMSTPAENTRLRTCVSAKHGGFREDKHIPTTSMSEVQLRERRQVLKISGQLQSIQRRNKYVSNWLQQSESTFNNNSDKSEIQKKFEKVPQVLIDKSINRKPTVKQLCKQAVNVLNTPTSDVSEVSFKTVPINDSVSGETPQKESAEMEASIGLGHSALSGRSSTARCRLNKAKKMQNLQRFHGKAEVLGSDSSDKVNLMDEIHGNDEMASEHDRNSQQDNTSDNVSHKSGGEADRSECSNQGSRNQSTSVTNTKQQQVDNAEQNEVEDGEEKEEDVIDLKVLDQYKSRLDEGDQHVYYNMFEMIITKLAVVQNSIKEVREEQNQINTSIESIGRTLDVCVQSIDDIDAEVDEVNDANVKLVESVIKIDDKITALDADIHKIVTENNKGSFIVNGYYIDKKDDAKENLQSFFKQQMEITDGLELTSAHKMGNAFNSPVWFRLKDPNDVATVYDHVKNLKDKTNNKGKSYRVREYMDEKTREQKTRTHDIIMENRRLPEAHRIEHTFQKGKLIVNDEMYQKEVNEPTVKDMLLLSREQEAILEDIPLHSSEQKAENGNLFQAYMIEADSIEKVEQAYRAIFKKHISATHVMCAHRIFGSSFHRLQDYVEGKEHGGGRAILNTMKDSGVWNIAVFVVRYHAGPNLGPRRFEIMKELTRNVITSYPHRLNYGQFFSDQITLTALNAAAKRPEQNTNNTMQERGRGRGQRGRGGRRGRRGSKP